MDQHLIKAIERDFRELLIDESYATEWRHFGNGWERPLRWMLTGYDAIRKDCCSELRVPYIKNTRGSIDVDDGPVPSPHFTPDTHERIKRVINDIVEVGSMMSIYICEQCGGSKSDSWMDNTSLCEECGKNAEQTL